MINSFSYSLPQCKLRRITLALAFTDLDMHTMLIKLCTKNRLRTVELVQLVHQDITVRPVRFSQLNGMVNFRKSLHRNLQVQFFFRQYRGDILQSHDIKIFTPSAIRNSLIEGAQIMNSKISIHEDRIRLDILNEFLCVAMDCQSSFSFITILLHISKSDARLLILCRQILYLLNDVFVLQCGGNEWAVINRARFRPLLQNCTQLLIVLLFHDLPIQLILLCCGSLNPSIELDYIIFARLCIRGPIIRTKVNCDNIAILIIKCMNHMVDCNDCAREVYSLVVAHIFKLLLPSVSKRFQLVYVSFAGLLKLFNVLCLNTIQNRFSLRDVLLNLMKLTLELLHSVLVTGQ